MVASVARRVTAAMVVPVVLVVPGLVVGPRV
jgi:hypothetical protein